MLSPWSRQTSVYFPCMPARHQRPQHKTVPRTGLDFSLYWSYSRSFAQATAVNGNHWNFSFMDFLPDKIVFMSCLSFPTFAPLWSTTGSNPVSLFLSSMTQWVWKEKWNGQLINTKIRYSEAKKVFIRWWLNFLQQRMQQDQEIHCWTRFWQQLWCERPKELVLPAVRESRKLDFCRTYSPVLPSSLKGVRVHEASAGHTVSTCLSETHGWRKAGAGSSAAVRQTGQPRLTLLPRAAATRWGREGVPLPFCSTLTTYHVWQWFYFFF